MKIKHLLILLAVDFTLMACTNTDFNYPPQVELLYSPIRLKDSAAIVLKKGNSVNELKIDSMKIGDTLSVKIHLYDLMYNLESVKLNTGSDTSTIVVLPTDAGFKARLKAVSDNSTGHLVYQKKIKSDNIDILYVARKSSKSGHLTIYLETANPDSVNYMDSLKINTPVKFL